MTKALYAICLVLLVLPPSQTMAELVVDLSGNSGSSIIQISISGSGIWPTTRDGERVVWAGAGQEIF